MKQEDDDSRKSEVKAEFFLLYTEEKLFNQNDNSYASVYQRELNASLLI